MKNCNMVHWYGPLFAGLLQDLSEKHLVQISLPSSADWFGTRAAALSTMRALGGIGKALDAHLANGGTPWEVVKTSRFDEATDRLDVRDWCYDLAIEVAIQSAPIQAKILRQVFLFYSKLNYPHEASTQNQAFLDFVDRDRALRPYWTADRRSDFRNTSICYHAREFITRVLSNLPRDYNPKHGPGAVAAGEKGICQKMRFRYRPSLRFPFDEWFFVSPSHVCDTWGFDARPKVQYYKHYVGIQKLLRSPSKVIHEALISNDERRLTDQGNGTCVTSVHSACYRHGNAIVKGQHMLAYSQHLTAEGIRDLLASKEVDKRYALPVKIWFTKWWDQPTEGFRSCSRVVAVPKDFRGPRIICAEPKENQWLQQGLWETIARRVHTHPYTSRSIDFRDQELSRIDALNASITNARSTIDLKEASDRVALDLVYCLFGDSRIRDIYLDMLDTRSREADVPGIGVVKLRKFATMGSALCFPIQSLTFLALCVGAEAATYASSRVNYASIAKRYRVFGDDIILPRDRAGEAIRALEMAGLMVNQDKSCINSAFKESCGMDAYLGIQVTPIRWRVFVDKRISADDLAALAAVHNQLRSSGYTRTADVVLSFTRELLPDLCVLPSNWGPTVPFGAFLVGRSLRMPIKVCKKTQSLLGYTYQAVPRRGRPLDGWDGVLAALSPGSTPKARLEYTRSVPSSDSLKRGWVRLGA